MCLGAKHDFPNGDAAKNLQRDLCNAPDVTRLLQFHVISCVMMIFVISIATLSQIAKAVHTVEATDLNPHNDLYCTLSLNFFPKRKQLKVEVPTPDSRL